MALKEKILYDAKQYLWDDPFLFKLGADNLLRQCVTAEEVAGILWHCHNSPYGGYFNGERTTAKVLQSGFYWPTLFKDAYLHCTIMSIYWLQWIMSANGWKQLLAKTMMLRELSSS